MANPVQTNQLLNLASKIVQSNQALLAVINGGNPGDVNLTGIQGLVDEYVACTAVTPYTDGLFTGTSLQFLNAFNIGDMVTVLQVFLQIYNDTANYTNNAGRNKSIMQLCQPG